MVAFASYEVDSAMSDTQKPLREDVRLLGELLGVASVTYKRGEQRLAIIDTPLQS